MTTFSQSSQSTSKKIWIAVSFVILLVGGWIIFGPSGALKYYKVTKELKTVRAEIKALESQNKALREEIAKLLSDPVYIEELARKKYGFIKKNEIIYDFEKKKKNR